MFTFTIIGRNDQSSCESYFTLPATGASYFYLLAERVGFEPTVPFGTPDFKSGAIDQLCHLSFIYNYMYILKNFFSVSTI